MTIHRAPQPSNPAEASSLEEKIEALLESPLKASGIVLLEVEMLAQEQQVVVRLSINTLDGGVGIEACARASELAGRILEVEDPIASRYVLEVSSPGIYRKLRQPRHFVQSLGKHVHITLDADWVAETLPQGSKDPIRLGVLKALEEDDAHNPTVVVYTTQGELRVGWRHIRKARLNPEEG